MKKKMYTHGYKHLTRETLFISCECNLSITEALEMIEQVKNKNDHTFQLQRQVVYV